MNIKQTVLSPVFKNEYNKMSDKSKQLLLKILDDKQNDIKEIDKTTAKQIRKFISYIGNNFNGEDEFHLDLMQIDGIIEDIELGI